ncbi:hypothetical protein [Mucilaginibacter dorajii]|uniref:Transmembrane protein n=1 Tax=Mucilaginibacter dorajii TaxID=692994 RepID=A0ABP7PE73_9SPHI|nr:hypothetical protein [Mucilaginibacter dorajii]MCS3734611.1 hypothetical protein [Mucilaginibacter dorajii]
MEIPYNGRAIVEDNFDSVRIIIPAKRNNATLAFLCVWLCGWFFGEFSVSSTVFTSQHHNAPDLFMIVWLTGWTLGGFFALKTALWQLAGKEIIEIGKGTLELKKKNDWFSKIQVYDLNGCKSFRVQDDSIYSNQGRFGSLRGFKGDSIGTILFDYGMKTVRFGEAVEEAEGKYLLGILKSKRLLVDKNFE